MVPCGGIFRGWQIVSQSVLLGVMLNHHLMKEATQGHEADVSKGSSFTIIMLIGWLLRFRCQIKH